jgi:protein TonB
MMPPEGERFGLALFVSALLHITLILGLSFYSPRIRDIGHESLEITLVMSHTDRTPLDAQFLAQTNQQGGGQSEKPVTARSPLPAVEFSDRARMPVATPPPEKPVSALRQWWVMLTRPAAKKPAVAEAKPAPQPREAKREPEHIGLVERERRNERAQLAAIVDRSWQTMQQQPREKVINARTREYKYAAYMDAWRAKIERIGNMHYPAEAKRLQLGGSLVLDVAIRTDGSVQAVTVLRPSGHAVLDDAAVRIVELAAPFAPLPPDLRAETDLLHITRTWRFRDTGFQAE